MPPPKISLFLSSSFHRPVLRMPPHPAFSNKGLLAYLEIVLCLSHLFGAMTSLATNPIDLVKLDLPSLSGKKLTQVLASEGFAQLINAPFDHRAAENLTSWYFSLPQAEKEMVYKREWSKQEDAPIYRGATPLLAGASSLKELVEVGSPEYEQREVECAAPESLCQPARWPLLSSTSICAKDTSAFGCREALDFKAAMQAYFRSMEAIGKQLLELIGMELGLGLPGDASFFSSGMSTLRLIE